MAWLIHDTEPPRFAPVRARWCADEARVQITVARAGTLHLFLYEARDLVAELDSIISDTDTDPCAADTGARGRARLRLVIVNNNAG